MAHYLVIVESPSKAKTIGKYLGPDYVVKASMGHLRDLQKSTMSASLPHTVITERSRLTLAFRSAASIAIMSCAVLYVMNHNIPQTNTPGV